MKTTLRSALVAVLLAGLAFTTGNLRAASTGEDKLIAALDSPRAELVTEALQKLEKEYPTSTNAFPKMRKLLSDDRAKVRRKAARVLGMLHAPVDDNDLKAILAMFKASDPQEVMDALKALRGLNAASTVKDITPLLNHSTRNVVRDALRTLAALGTKDLIPTIEPLLKNSDPAVQKDAQDAIFQLKNK
jgi:vesicle coat complex subunit